VKFKTGDVTMPPIKICPECQKDCRPLVTPASGLQHSEWYCEHCHISYPMEKAAAQYYAAVMQPQR
jgi:hypothetical protein